MGTFTSHHDKTGLRRPIKSLVGLTCSAAMLFTGIMTTGTALADETTGVDANGNVAINAINFPDEQFRSFIEGYDTNGDGTLSQSERDAVTSMTSYTLYISNFKGLEFFHNLTEFDASTDESVTFLDFSHNTKLQKLGFRNNDGLTSLDLSHNTELTTLDLYGDNLTSLDLSHNTKLVTVNLDANDNLSSLNVTKLPKLTNLSAGSTKLASLDVTENPKLENLNVYGTELTTLDVRNNPRLQSLSVSSYGGNNLLQSLDVTKNPELQSLTVQGSKLTSLDVSKNTKLTKLDLWNNQLTELNVTNNQFLTELSVSQNQLPALDVSKNTRLTTLSVDGNKLTSFDVSNNPELTTLSVSINQLPALDVSRNTKLTVLAAGDNPISSIDLGNNPNLTDLSVSNAKLTSLNVTNNPALESLDADQNQIQSIDLTHNPELSQLNLSDNQLTWLDLSKNSKLSGELKLYDNKLVTLDVSNNPDVRDLQVYNNSLIALSVNSKLYSAEISGSKGTQLFDYNGANLDLSNYSLVDITQLSNMECGVLSGTVLTVPDCINRTATFTSPIKNKSNWTLNSAIMFHGLADKISPHLYGIDDTYVKVGGSFDPKENVYAIDDEDGRIEADNITIDGKVDVNIPGDYTIKYAVSDKAGNLTSMIRKVTVYDPVVGKRSFLQNQIEQYKELSEADYTANSWKAFQTVLDEAKALVKKADATEQELADESGKLTDAYNGLEKKSSTTAADKTALDAAVKTAESKKQDAYTPESWTPFAKALADAKTVQAN
ncbi:DUF5011 domain-containing protein, partial [Bifidobacterium sp. 82T10]